jgi:hypothetical protein
MSSEVEVTEMTGPSWPSTESQGHNPYPEVNAQLLAGRALDIVVRDLEAYGNVLSEWHRASLYELLETFSYYLIGREQGRQTFGLPTGMGKTSAVVAFVTALHELGYRVPIAIASSRVQALSDIQATLEAHGVPADWIGVKHAAWDAEVESTGNASRLIQLVTHARVRGGRDFDLYGEHQGQSRPLMIWDESLLRSDGVAFSESSLREALAVLLIAFEGRKDTTSAGLLRYLQDAVKAITDKLTEIDETNDLDRRGVPVTLPPLNEHVLAAYRVAVLKARRVLRQQYADALASFLVASQSPMQVIKTEQGAGAVSISEAIPAPLKNVVILDASASVRKLIHADSSVRAVVSFRPEDQKNFAKVNVYQIRSGGGRSTLEDRFLELGPGPSSLSREIVDLVKANLPTARAFLLFTFLPKGIDMADLLARDLTRAGIDLKEKTSDGKRRFEFLTWGNHEGINGYEHCDVVIMVGVVQRSLFELAAATKAQQKSLDAATPSERLRAMRESEVAHAVYQGASRGSCRRVTNGMAGAMKLYIIHRSPELQALMAQVMPNAVWIDHQPKHLAKANEAVKTQGMLGDILVYLNAVTGDTQKVSTTAAKKDMGLTGATVAEAKLFSRACKELDLILHGWEHQGRSFVRAATAHGYVE